MNIARLAALLFFTLMLIPIDVFLVSTWMTMLILNVVAESVPIIRRPIGRPLSRNNPAARAAPIAQRNRAIWRLQDTLGAP